jgi:hypothetical protein
MNADFQTIADQILESLAKELGIPELEFEEETETCTLQIGEKDRVNITCDQTNQEIILHAEMGLLPPNNRNEVVEQLLEANLFWAGTRGATISIERQTGTVIVARSMSLYESSGTVLQGKTIAAAIIDLVEIMEHWATLLEKKI